MIKAGLILTHTMYTVLSLLVVQRGVVPAIEHLVISRLQIERPGPRSYLAEHDAAFFIKQLCGQSPLRLRDLPADGIDCPLLCQDVPDSFDLPQESGEDYHSLDILFCKLLTELLQGVELVSPYHQVFPV